MKTSKLVLGFMVLFSATQAVAQSSLRFFLSPAAVVSAPVKEGKIESSEYSGFFLGETNVEYLGEEYALPLNRGAELAGGIVWRDRFFLSAGLRYFHREDEGICYCALCGKLPLEPTALQADFWEIPLQLRWEPWPEAVLTPYLAGELSWGWADWEGLSLGGYALGLGGRWQFAGRWAVLLEANFRSSVNFKNDYPNWYYREGGLRTGLVFEL